MIHVISQEQNCTDAKNNFRPSYHILESWEHIQNWWCFRITLVPSPITSQVLHLNSSMHKQ